MSALIAWIIIMVVFTLIILAMIIFPRLEVKYSKKKTSDSWDDVIASMKRWEEVEAMKKTSTRKSNTKRR